mgnify:CR=1 FL=1
MPTTFEGFGIAFLYPDSWTVDAESDVQSVSLESPEGAFFTVSKYDNTADADAAVERAVSAMQQEYEQVEREPVEKNLLGLHLVGSVLRFVYLDLIIASQLLALTHAGHTYLMQFLPEGRDHERLQAVFDAMLTSMCQSLVNQ